MQENIILKEQIEVHIRENSILKRAVAIQHERQKEYDDRNQEVQHLKQLVAQYQEQLRTLEVKIDTHELPVVQIYMLACKVSLREAFPFLFLVGVCFRSLTHLNLLWGL